MQLVDAYTFLFHGVTETDRYTIILQSIMVNCNTVRSSNSILTAVTFTDRIFFIILATEVELQHVDDLFSLFRKPVFFHQWQYGEFDRSQGCRQFQNNACFTVFKCLFAV